MSDEPEMIEQQMAARRAALTEKIADLEEKVTSSVQTATEGVEHVTEKVQGTMAALSHVVDSMKDSLNLTQHTREHPWLVFGGAMVAGFVVGRLLTPSREPPAEQAPSVSRGEHRVRTNGHRGEHAPRHRPAAQPESSAMMEQFKPELSKLKGLAIGAVLGLARDMILQATPEAMRSNLSDTIDDITAKMGGRPVRGSMLETPGESGRSERGSATSESQGESAHKRRFTTDSGRGQSREEPGSGPSYGSEPRFSE